MALDITPLGDEGHFRTKDIGESKGRESKGRNLTVFAADVIPECLCYFGSRRGLVECR